MGLTYLMFRATKLMTGQAAGCENSLMKLYVHYEDGPDESELTLKLTLPKKWVSQPISQVLELFLESYNKKRPSNILDINQVHFAKAGGESIRPNEIVQDCVSSCEDVYVKHGALGPLIVEKENSGAAAPQGSTKDDAASGAEGGKLRCRNYGCNQHFDEEGNHDTACKFHTAPPVFHDTKKGWSCCPKRVYDWDEFNQIEGCSVGRHSTLDPKQVFAASPTVTAAAGAEARSQPVLKSIEDYNKQNPNAVSAVSAAKETRKPASTVQADGTAKCLNKGCQKTFKVAENSETACSFHASAPVFHDAGKFWSCCPEKVKYDFDEFLKIPGCMVGWHNDGTAEAQERLALARKIAQS